LPHSALHTGVAGPASLVIMPLLEPIMPLLEPIMPLLELIMPLLEPIMPLVEPIMPLLEPIMPLVELPLLDPMVPLLDENPEELVLIGSGSSICDTLGSESPSTALQLASRTGVSKS
jgi:hypothetical protein